LIKQNCKAEKQKLELPHYVWGIPVFLLLLLFCYPNVSDTLTVSGVVFSSRVLVVMSFLYWGSPRACKPEDGLQWGEDSCGEILSAI